MGVQTVSNPLPAVLSRFNGCTEDQIVEYFYREGFRSVPNDPECCLIADLVRPHLDRDASVSVGPLYGKVRGILRVRGEIIAFRVTVHEGSLRYSHDFRGPLMNVVMDFDDGHHQKLVKKVIRHQPEVQPEGQPQAVAA